MQLNIFVETMLHFLMVLCGIKSSKEQHLFEIQSSVIVYKSLLSLLINASKVNASFLYESISSKQKLND